MERVVWLTLRLLTDIVGTPLPTEIMGQLLPDQPDPELVEEARRLLLDRGSGAVALTPDLAALGETNCVIGKLRLALRRVFISKRLLGREYNVNPRSLKIYLYYFVRFAHLLRSYRASAESLLQGDQDARAAAQRERAKVALNSWLGGGNKNP